MRNTNKARTRWLIGLTFALTLALVCACAMADVEINETNFPDQVFRTYVDQKFGTDDPNNEGVRIITDEDINDIRVIDVKEMGIERLDGIQFFTALDGLDCSYNKLASLNLTQNKQLTVVYCNNNSLTSLDLSQNTALEEIRCSYNSLTSLDFSQNTALEKIYCRDNQLKSLNISNNTKLTRLVCYYNPLGTLDVSQNTALTWLSCTGCGLKTLNVSNNKALRTFECQENELTSLNVNENTVLFDLRVDENQLTKLDVSQNKELEALSVAGNKLTEIDVTACTELDFLHCFDNQLTSLDVSRNEKLRTLACHNNSITSLNLSNNPMLSFFTCMDNPLTTLDISSVYDLNALVTTGMPKAIGKYLLWGEDEDPEDIDSYEELLQFAMRDLVVNQGVKIITKKGVYPRVTNVALDKQKGSLTRTGKQLQPTLTLTATVSPAYAIDRSVTWSSDKPKVAKVDQNGKVTALKAGKATITCAANDGSGVLAKCTVTVKDTKVSKITLNKTKATLKVGKTLKLKVKKFSPASPVNQKVKWSSNKPKIARVDQNGKVTALKAGKCVITCTAQDGSKKKATCKITIK